MHTYIAARKEDSADATPFKTLLTNARNTEVVEWEEKGSEEESEKERNDVDVSASHGKHS
jgi:hypothetical protein